jgi:hypothetical protein
VGAGSITPSPQAREDNDNIMAKEEIKKEEVKAKSEQELRWEQFLEKYKKSNPEKYEARVKAGLKMPENF